MASVRATVPKKNKISGTPCGNPLMPTAKRTFDQFQAPLPPQPPPPPPAFTLELPGQSAATRCSMECPKGIIFFVSFQMQSTPHENAM
jgi:hypothetical protein